MATNSNLNKGTVEPILLSPEQVYQICGGNIAIKAIYALMKQNIIQTIESNEKRKFITHRKYVDEFMNRLFRGEFTFKDMQNDKVATVLHTRPKFLDQETVNKAI